MKKNHVNRKLFLFTSCLAFILIILLTKSAESRRIETATFKTFEDWCKNKDSLNEEVKHTINVLLAKVKTSDCKIANEKLSDTWFIDLSHSEISNLLPLSSFTKLTRLNLADNQIVDIKPLEKLTKLTDLGILGNRISDISPLRNMKDLYRLSAQRNQISDVTPLKGLIKLNYLLLHDNKISDVTPLKELIKLNYLLLHDNKITDIMPLQSLTGLQAASFRRNPIINKVCPVANPVNDLPICSF